MTYTQADLQNFNQQHEYLVGIDSDGCVFDTMEIKQKQCFHGEICKVWGLEAIEGPVRETAEFINLYSRWRGINRFPALLMTFDLLAERQAATPAAPLPDTAALRAYIESGLPLSNATLRAEVERTGDPELRRVLDWSLAVNVNVERTVKQVPPFRWVRESLDKLKPRADLIVVSQTPTDALVREWRENGIEDYVHLIAGQELGTKSEHLQLATAGRYAADRVLMIGDAPGDRKAAQSVNACFYPINPGREEASWQRLHDEAADRFFNGTFDDVYQAALIAEFEALLPETPPWK